MELPEQSRWPLFGVSSPVLPFRQVYVRKCVYLQHRPAVQHRPDSILKEFTWRGGRRHVGIYWTDRNNRETKTFTQTEIVDPVSDWLVNTKVTFRPNDHIWTFSEMKSTLLNIKPNAGKAAKTYLSSMDDGWWVDRGTFCGFSCITTHLIITKHNSLEKKMILKGYCIPVIILLHFIILLSRIKRQKIEKERSFIFLCSFALNGLKY